MNSIKSLPENKRRENLQTHLMISELITLLPRSDRDITRKEKLWVNLPHEHGHNNSQQNISLRQYKPHILPCFKQVFFKEATKRNKQQSSIFIYHFWYFSILPLDISLQLVSFYFYLKNFLWHVLQYKATVTKFSQPLFVKKCLFYFHF